MLDRVAKIMNGSVGSDIDGVNLWVKVKRFSNLPDIYRLMIFYLNGELTFTYGGYKWSLVSLTNAFFVDMDRFEYEPSSDLKKFMDQCIKYRNGESMLLAISNDGENWFGLVGVAC